MDSPWSDLGRPPLREAALRRALTTGPGAVWRDVEVLASTPSTNADALARAAAGAAEGLVVVTDHQTAGRGRLDRTWQTPPRAALAVSVLLRPGVAGEDPDGGPLPVVDPARWSWLPLLTGVAVVDALTRTCGLPARLKWPNDVLVPRTGLPGDEPGKVAGILAELATGPDGAAAVVVGTGLNITQTAAELPVPTATSLAMAGAATTDRDTVLRAYLRALAERYRAWRRAAGDPRASGLAAAYREACATVGLEVAVDLPGERLLGIAEGVDDDGRLVVREPSGAVRPVAAGDVVHVRPAGAPAASPAASPGASPGASSGASSGPPSGTPAPSA